ncbi:IS200/IS605 family element transposase accessory protein TnpB [Scytonema sp. UIC 10036]|uniref:IS200/IS605 family accessory protein TnpB-related protein n=1 Tax=Scytonema sp. UIC 10036 TaxID=2304196 RepID=UPI0012DAC8BE|nr:IS200/IS605 family accessory protein TnpB-related protein [Scytonema sp. UIC 10036]MUG95974.1 IS200/IS605 family element transposase accessory protein TnpB [Scytonema sp. UIC 10036]
MSIITIQTIAPNSPDNTIALDYLRDYALVFGQATRTAFSKRNRIGQNKTKESEIEKQICKELETRFGLSNSEAKNVYNKASAAYASQAELVDTYIDEAFDRIKGISKTIKKLEFKLSKAVASGQTSTVKKFKKKIHYKQQKINQLEAKIARLKKSKSDGTFSVTFGSSQLFEKQYSLERNGYKSHEEWLEDWRNARSNRSFFIGSKNFLSGNQLVRYDALQHTLTITCTPGLRAKYGDSVTLHDISFARGEEWLLAAIEPVRRTSTRNGKNGEKIETYRNGSNLPCTWEIVNRDGKFYINATLESPDPQLKSSLENGALGIDFNPGSIDWTLIDRHGNLKRHGSLKINVQDKRSLQTKDIIGKAVALLVRIALEYGVPIVIEDLDFAKTKASMKEKGAKYARMLSNMAYSQFTQMIKSRCLKEGVELIKVDAVYTSVIGTTKYMAVYGLNSGCAAALVIARRGQGRTEKLPNSLHTYFKKPEDFSKSGAWKKVARKINICGGYNRHKFYHPSHKKQVKTNSLLYGKLRQTKVSSRRDTVQVLVTPYIHQKPRAVGCPDLKGVNP